VSDAERLQRAPSWSQNDVLAGTEFDPGRSFHWKRAAAAPNRFRRQRSNRQLAIKLPSPRPDHGICPPRRAWVRLERFLRLGGRLSSLRRAGFSSVSPWGGFITIVENGQSPVRQLPQNRLNHPYGNLRGSTSQPLIHPDHSRKTSGFHRGSQNWSWRVCDHAGTPNSPLSSAHELVKKAGAPSER
jgi:hypothetical protein